MDEQLVREYIEAYRDANPERPDPKVEYYNGWYYIKYGGDPTTPYRKAKVAEMRDRLRARAGKMVPVAID